MPTLEHSYHDLDSGRWLKGNLHAHSNFSDGSRPHQQVIDDYAARGYDFLMFSDHDCLTDHARLDSLDAKGMVLIPGNEVTAHGPHLLHVNARSQVTPYRQRQAVIDNAVTDGGFVIVNHPDMGMKFDHCPARLLVQWRGYIGVEIFNGLGGVHRGSPYALNKWDIALASGHRVWGFAGDDSHAVDDVGLGWVVANVKSPGVAGVVDALMAGRFYSSTGVNITDIAVDGMHVELRTDTAERIVAIGTGGKRLATVDGSAIAFDMPARIKYVRFECWGPGESFAWSQPMWVDLRG